jgi:hypothetical protein
MDSVLLRLALGAALVALAAADVHALGFGAGTTATTIGQPLDFSATIDGDDFDPTDRCVFAEVRVGDSRLAADVRATLESGPRPGERRVRVTTRGGIDEPVATIDVTIGCASRLSRRFVAFIDPPTLRLATAEPAPFVPQHVESEVAGLVDVVRASSPLRARADGARRAAPVRVVAKASPRRAATARRSAGPRLQLDGPSLPPSGAASAPEPAEAPQTAIASSRSKASGTAHASEARADEAAAALAVERARIAELEAVLAQVRGEAEAQRKALAALQASLRDAEAERHAGVTRLLLAIAVPLLLVFGWMAWALHHRGSANARWLEANRHRPPGGAAAAAAVPAAIVDDPAPRISQPPSEWIRAPQAIVPVTAPAAIGGLEVTTVLAPQSHYARLAREEASANAAPPHEPASPLDELLDLEQQVEFYAVLDQEDAAVALLESHLRRHGTTSPLPYLHLLDLHRRSGHRGAFERVRSEHGGRFAAAAAEWDDADGGERGLVDHAQIVANLQVLWSTPSEAIRLLETLLLARGGDTPALHLASYRDLLFLYSVARDLAAVAAATRASAIDLYLPLGDDTPTMPLRRDDGGYASDLDDASRPETAAEALVVRRSSAARGG